LAPRPVLTRMRSGGPAYSSRVMVVVAPGEGQSMASELYDVVATDTVPRPGMFSRASFSAPGPAVAEIAGVA
jgi:hypothetical protein